MREEHLRRVRFNLFDSNAVVCIVATLYYLLISIINNRMIVDVACVFFFALRSCKLRYLISVLNEQYKKNHNHK